jgi:membrane protein YdbS with pleckstrin-like domain
MRPVGFPGRLLNDGEYVVLTTRSHGKTLTGPVLVLLLTAFVTTFALVRAGRELGAPLRSAAVLAIIVLAVAIVARLVVLPFLRWLTTTYTFTNRRFAARTGLLARQGRTIPLDRIVGIDVERGLLDRLLGCGTLVVSDAGEDGRLELHDIPHAEEVQTLVADQVHRLRHDDRPLPEWTNPPFEHVGEDGTGGIRLNHRS